MADVTARSLQYEYKAVSMFAEKCMNTNTCGVGSLIRFYVVELS